MDHRVPIEKLTCRCGEDIFGCESSIDGKPLQGIVGQAKALKALQFGLDIKEKKLTLPLIHALQQVSASDRRWMVDVVKNRNEDSAAVARVIAKVVEAGGIAHATRRMLEYRDEALQVLHT
ncbi:MAG TPA: polyprenyl synthetase family protein, partial [Deltaproteobacteria bacterium]|nr:polyprenyl synthetase family protein [Deltaproteobacteria bacterium]